MIADIELYLTGLIIFSVPAMLLSIPSYYVLKKRNRIFITDYFIPAYATTLLAILFKYFEPLYYGGGISEILADNLWVTICSIIINYLKIYIPDRISTKVLSIASVVILFIITIILFMFIPSTGE